MSDEFGRGVKGTPGPSRQNKVRGDAPMLSTAAVYDPCRSRTCRPDGGADIAELPTRAKVRLRLAPHAHVDEKQRTRVRIRSKFVLGETLPRCSDQ